MSGTQKTINTYIKKQKNVTCIKKQKNVTYNNEKNKSK